MLGVVSLLGRYGGAHVSLVGRRLGVRLVLDSWLSYDRVLCCVVTSYIKWGKSLVRERATTA